MELKFTNILTMMFIVFLAAVATGSDSGGGSSRPSPILFITGYTGSRLTVLDTTDGECNTNDNFITAWVNKTHISNVSRCFLKQMRLNYTGGRYLDTEGVTVKNSNFGSLSSLVDLSDLFPDSNETITNFVDYFVERGYTADVNIRTAPYDWRLGVEQLEERGYYENLKKLVEQMYEDNGDTKVTLLVLSYGGPVSHYFLTKIVDQEWKDTFIHSYVSLAAAWSGANALNTLLTPPPFNLFLFFHEINASVEELRDLSRTFASSYFLMPHESAWKDTILVKTPTKNYTASDYLELFTDAGYPQGYTQYSENEFDFAPPNVPTYCFYGLGFPTAETYVYDDEFPDSQPTILFGDGDITVNKQSLEVCLRWADSGYPFNRTVFYGLNHFTIATDIAVIEALRDIVGAPAEPINVCRHRADPGSCDGVISRYFFNSERGVCEEFTYGGCDGNGNNFETFEACEQRCNPNGCPPLCTKEYCTHVNTRRSLCTIPTQDQQGDCSAECRITYCHTCYYGDEYRPNPGDCNTCPYYPKVNQARNRCFKRWATCTRRANGRQYTKARGRKEKTQEKFKCYEHPCVQE